MKKIIRFTESDLIRIVKKVIQEQITPSVLGDVKPLVSEQQTQSKTIPITINKSYFINQGNVFNFNGFTDVQLKVGAVNSTNVNTPQSKPNLRIELTSNFSSPITKTDEIAKNEINIDSTLNKLMRPDSLLTVNGNNIIFNGVTNQQSGKLPYTLLNQSVIIVLNYMDIPTFRQSYLLVNGVRTQ